MRLVLRSEPLPARATRASGSLWNAAAPLCPRPDANSWCAREKDRILLIQNPRQLTLRAGASRASALRWEASADSALEGVGCATTC
jgi:hypothetical protein